MKGFATPAGGGEENGSAVALAEGGWAFVGSPSFAAGSGRVHVYQNLGGFWIHQASLAAILLWCAALGWYQLAVTGTELLAAAVDMQAAAGLVMIFVLLANGALLIFARRSMGQA